MKLLEPQSMLPSLITELQLVNGVVTSGPLMRLLPHLLLVASGRWLKLQLLVAMDGMQQGHLLLWKVPSLLLLWLLLAGTPRCNPLLKAGSRLGCPLEMSLRLKVHIL